MVLKNNFENILEEFLREMRRNSYKTKSGLPK